MPPLAQLFATEVQARAPTAGLEPGGDGGSLSEYHGTRYLPEIDGRMLEVFARVANPADALELRDLWLGRVECEIASGARRPEFVERWRNSRVRRSPDAEALLSSRSTVRFIKELFNAFFRDDLYGRLRSDSNLILSSGSLDEQAFGLPEPLKETIRFALARDWYGYSDSRGREPCREAVAAYENVRLGRPSYSAANVALTMGGTFAVNAVADFLLGNHRRSNAPALCAIPNYPPLVESVARRSPVQLVPLACRDGAVSLLPLIRALKPDTPLVLLQTVNNPTGGVLVEEELATLLQTASSSTAIILDECHECVGGPNLRTSWRAASNVIRVTSLSKTWSAPGLKVGWILADPALIADYYEYASSTYGGPPSLFYTLIEVLARMERWMLTGLGEPGTAEVDEFEPGYGLTRERLVRAFAVYRSDRTMRDRALRNLRTATLDGFRAIGADAMIPQGSINVAVTFPEWDDSYVCFRDLLHGTGISLFPGILTFCFSGGVMRATTARPWTTLSDALARLANRPFPAVASRRPASEVRSDALCHSPLGRP
jgi:aspartate/methionine/tyrosine aminotransferase